MPQRDETYISFRKLALFSVELVKLWAEERLEKELQDHWGFVPARKMSQKPQYFFLNNFICL